MGVTAFISGLETFFLNKLDEKDIPRHLDVNDWAAVQAWFSEAFGRWFLSF